MALEVQHGLSINQNHKLCRTIDVSLQIYDAQILWYMYRYNAVEST